VRTQVGIVGGGPAGLLLSHLLHLRGIESVVLERRSREDLETTVRAGVLEHGTAGLLNEVGVGERMEQEVVKYVIRARLEADGRILFEASAESVEGPDTDSPKIRYLHDGQREEISCDYVAGCDGSFGVCRSGISEDARTEYSRTYPFGWFGILVEGPPSTEELIYTLHDRGFALVSTRSPEVQRLYFQCDPQDDVEEWP